MSEHFDALETRSAAEREREQMQALSAQVAHAKAHSGYFGELLKDVDPAKIVSREALAGLPVTRKSDLAARQKAARPLGGLNAVPIARLAHIFASPGGIYEPDTTDKDYWRFARGMWAAGVRPGDIVHNTFSYHLTPAGMLVESAARAIGCPVFPGGVGNTELQAQAMAEIGCTAYAGTPSFLRILLAKADELKLDVSALKRGLVGGEALTPSVRKELSDRGIEVSNSYGTADLGLIAYESSAREGLIVDEGIIVEVVEPLGSKPVADGEVGEVVVTTFNKAYPLLRFATGDLSAVLPGASPCGRTNMRLRGWLGRADQSTKFKGMFVHPSQVMEVARRHPEIAKARLVVSSEDNVDVMTFKVAVNGPAEGLEAGIAESIHTVMKLRGRARIVDASELPDDGRVIEDARTYE